MSKEDKDSYYKSGQYDPDHRRKIVWNEIVKFLSSFVPKNATVVDLGAGYCDFINSIEAAKKYAVDYSPELEKYAGAGVHKINKFAWQLEELGDGTVDIVHASNLFEHFTEDELTKTIVAVKRILKNDGKIILMQPNYRLCADRYFDDHTHKKIFNDASLESFLLENGFKIILKKPRFLPLEMKSSPSIIPQFLIPFVVRTYIHSPIKPFAGQMLFVAQK